MTTNASALPALPTTNTDMRVVSERLNVIIRWFNRPDLFVPSYAPDTGSGTAYVASPSTDIKVYEVGQEFDFKAANANSSAAPTLNVNGLGAGTITKLGGAALALGDIAANSFNKVIVSSTTPTFELISPVAGVAIANTGATTFLANDVALNNVSNFFSGPNTGSIGASGQTWLIMGTACIGDSGAANVEAAIFDGTNYIADTSALVAAGLTLAITVSAVVTLTGATTFTLRAKDLNNTTGTLKTTGAASGVANKATSITAVRLA